LVLKKLSEKIRLEGITGDSQNAGQWSILRPKAIVLVPNSKVARQPRSADDYCISSAEVGYLKPGLQNGGHCFDAGICKKSCLVSKLRKEKKTKKA
jgi:hypothetical protein